MAAPTESTVQVPPNSTGAQVRMVQVTVLEAGVPTTVMMQVIQIADEFGNPLQFEQEVQDRKEMLDEMRAVRLGLQELISAGAKPNEVMNLIQEARNLRRDTDDSVMDAE